MHLYTCQLAATLVAASMAAWALTDRADDEQDS